jgi:hypothetical protein
VEELERATELALLLYKEGMTDYQRVLDTQRALLRQQDLYLESRGNVSLYLIGVYKALGGGWESGIVSTVASRDVSPPLNETVPAMEENRPELAPPRPGVPDLPLPKPKKGVEEEGGASSGHDMPGFATTAEKKASGDSFRSPRGERSDSDNAPILSPHQLPTPSPAKSPRPSVGYLLPAQQEEGGKVVIVSANKPTRTIYR